MNIISDLEAPIDLQSSNSIKIELIPNQSKPERKTSMNEEGSSKSGTGTGDLVKLPPEQECYYANGITA